MGEQFKMLTEREQEELHKLMGKVQSIKKRIEKRYAEIGVPEDVIDGILSGRGNPRYVFGDRSLHWLSGSMIELDEACQQGNVWVKIDDDGNVSIEEVE